MFVLGLSGAKRCGKSSIATLLAEQYGFQRIRLADTLKDMLRVLGLTDDQLEGDQKEVPCTLLCGKTPRLAMQTLGTEWGRDLLGADLWVNATQNRVLQVMAADPLARVVIEDVRFPNEAEMVLRLRGRLWRVRRPEVEPHMSVSETFQMCFMERHHHASEQHWRALPHHRELFNNGSLAELQLAVRELLQGEATGA